MILANAGNSSNVKMKLKFLIMLVIGASGFFVLFYPHDDLAFATQCAGHSIQGNFDLADTVFLGNVTSIQYTPFSNTAKILFDIHHVFKGDVGEEITIHYDLKQMFTERIAFAKGTSYVVLPVNEDGQHRVWFCTPVYQGVPTIVNGFHDLENNNETSFGNRVPWTLSEELLSDEVKKIEETQDIAFAMMLQNIDEVKDLEKNVRFVAGILMILGIVSGVIVVVVIIWKRRK